MLCVFCRSRGDCPTSVYTKQPMFLLVQPPINSVTSSQLRHTGDLLGASWWKNWKAWFSAIYSFCPILRFMRFWHYKTERNDILRRNRPSVSNFRSLQIVGCLKFMVFDILGKALHHQMIIGPPDGPLYFFQTPLASGWTAFGENPFWTMTPTQKIRETGQPPKIVTFW